MIVRLFSQNKVKVEVKYMKCITTNWMNKLFVILVTLGLSSISSSTDVSSSSATSETSATSKTSATQVKQDNNELEKLTILLEVLQVNSNNAILKFENANLKQENENLKNTLRRIEEKNKKQSEDYYQLKLHFGLIILFVLALIFYLKYFVLIGTKRGSVYDVRGL